MWASLDKSRGGWDGPDGGMTLKWGRLSCGLRGRGFPKARPQGEGQKLAGRQRRPSTG